MQTRRMIRLALACSIVPGGAYAQQSIWSFSAGPIFLRRDNPDHTPVFVDNHNHDNHNPPAAPMDSGSPTPVAILNGAAPVCFASDFNFDYQVGLDVNIRRFLTENAFIGARYFGVNDWDATKQTAILNEPGVATNPPSGEPVFRPSQAFAVYGSALHSTEINLLHQYNDWLTWLAGFRWIELGETIHAATSQDPMPRGEFNNNVNNHLYGAQIGAEVFIWGSERGCTIDGFVKAGVYGNSADHSANYVNNTPVITIAAAPQATPLNGNNSWWNHASATATSFVGEVGLTCSVSLLDWLSVRFGYEALWIAEVALASNQIPITPTTNHHGAITTNDGVFFHGGLLQIIAYW